MAAYAWPKPRTLRVRGPDEAVVSVYASGPEESPEDVARLLKGEPVDPARVYFRCTPTFEVSTPRLQWLTDNIFVGTGARAPNGVKIEVYILI